MEASNDIKKRALEYSMGRFGGAVMGETTANNIRSCIKSYLLNEGVGLDVEVSETIAGSAISPSSLTWVDVTCDRSYTVKFKGKCK